jgi:glycerol-3-phosphate dehydrogenase (NAD(P)+)
MSALTTVSVIGAGAYGTALANAVATSGRNVILYARYSAAAERIATSRLNPKLPGIRLHDDVVVTQDIARAADARTILIAVPAQSLRAASVALAPHLAYASRLRRGSSAARSCS